MSTISRATARPYQDSTRESHRSVAISSSSASAIRLRAFAAFLAWCRAPPLNSGCCTSALKEYQSCTGSPNSIGSGVCPVGSSSGISMIAGST